MGSRRTGLLHGPAARYRARRVFQLFGDLAVRLKYAVELPRALKNERTRIAPESPPIRTESSLDTVTAPSTTRHSLPKQKFQNRRELSYMRPDISGKRTKCRQFCGIMSL